MIIIVEGIDRCGKTTFVNKLCSKLPDMIRLKDINLCSKSYNDEDFKLFSLGKLDTSVAFLKQLSEQQNNVIVDRLHLTELVYGSVERQSTAYREIGQLDNILAKLDCILVLVEPTDLQWSNEQAEKDQTKHYHAFKSFYEISAIEKYHTNFKELDKMVDIILNRMINSNLRMAVCSGNCVGLHGEDVRDTKEIINHSSTYHDITTAEILKTFDLDLSLTMNFEYDIDNKIINTYGPYEMTKYHNIFDNLREAMQNLITDNINTRRCVIQFDKEHCFQNIQFLIRNNKLIVICNMRSCNVIDNFKSDIYICSILADRFKKLYVNMFSKSLEQTHDIIMNIGSLHRFKEKEETENASK